MQDGNTDAAFPSLSELEGAILSELYNRGSQTAFRVRRSFASSPSLEWRGSAGAVYAAIGRMEKINLIAGELQNDKRGSRLLRITETGVSALMSWACDIRRSVSVGLDPFRLRSGLWQGLPPKERQQVLNNILDAVQSDIATLKSFVVHDDLIEKTGIELAIYLQESRAVWLKTQIER